MKKVLGALFLIVWAAPLAAQSDFLDRARNIIDNMGETSDLLSDDNHQVTLSPFYGQEAPEVNLDPEDFDDEEVLRQSGDGPVARAFGNQKDSALSRPDMGLTVDDLSLADSAIATSDQTLGGLFNGTVGSCEADFAGGYTAGEQFCRRNLSANNQSCQQRRIASVDRDDRWECLVDTPTYKKVCGGPITYSCSGSSGASCLRNAISVTGGGATIERVGSRTYLTWPNSGDLCNIKTVDVTLRIAPGADLTGLRLGRYSKSGVIQVRSGSAYLHTSSYFFPNNVPEVRTFNVTQPLSLDTGVVAGLACLIPNVKSGNTVVGHSINYTGVPPRNLNVNLTSRVGSVSRSATLQSNGQVNVNMGATRTIPLRITFADEFETSESPRIELLMSGSCCSNVTAQVNTQCN